MNIIPSVLLLTCVGFLPNDCDGVTLTTSKGDLEADMRAVHEDPPWLTNKPPNGFQQYAVFVRTIDNFRYISEYFRARKRFPEAEVPEDILLRLHGVEFRRTSGFMLYEPTITLKLNCDHVFIAIRMTQIVVYAELDGGLRGRQAALDYHQRLEQFQNANLPHPPGRK